MISVFSGCQDQANTPSPGPLAEYTQIDYDPSWNTSGEKIIYAHSNLDPELSGIYSVNTDGTDFIHLISGYSSGPDWSPDENHFVYAQFNDLYISKSNGDSIMRLTFGSVSFDPKWNSSNNFIAYNRINSASSHSDIYIIRSDGSKNTFIDGNGKYPSWSDSGNSLIYFKPIYAGKYNSQVGDSLVQYFLNTGRIRTIVILESENYNFNSYPNMTDDGIIFCSKNSGGYSYIYKIDLNGENITRLTESQGYSPDYCSANQKVAYTNRSKGNGRLWIMDDNGSNKSQLTY